MEPQGAYLAVLAVLRGLAKAGVIDRNATAHVGAELAKEGNDLMSQHFQVEGHEILKLADAVARIHGLDA